MENWCVSDANSMIYQCKGVTKPGDIANTRRLRSECRKATKNYKVRVEDTCACPLGACSLLPPPSSQLVSPCCVLRRVPSMTWRSPSSWSKRWTSRHSLSRGGTCICCLLCVYMPAIDRSLSDCRRAYWAGQFSMEGSWLRLEESWFPIEKYWLYNNKNRRRLHCTLTVQLTSPLVGLCRKVLTGPRPRPRPMPASRPAPARQTLQWLAVSVSEGHVSAAA